jgi:hypothetical protein
MYSGRWWLNGLLKLSFRLMQPSFATPLFLSPSVDGFLSNWAVRSGVLFDDFLLDLFLQSRCLFGEWNISCEDLLNEVSITKHEFEVVPVTGSDMLLQLRLFWEDTFTVRWGRADKLASICVKVPSRWPSLFQMLEGTVSRLPVMRENLEAQQASPISLASHLDWPAYFGRGGHNIRTCT